MAEETASSMSSSNNPGNFPHHHPRRWGDYRNRGPFIESYNNGPQYYCYPESSYEFYGVPQYVPQNAVYSPQNQWVDPNILFNQLPYQPYTSELAATLEPAETKISFSKFSPDAPEFVMKNSVNATDPVESKDEKKKKKRKKKKPKIKDAEANNEVENENIGKGEIGSTTSSPPMVSESVKNMSKKLPKTVRFEDDETVKSEKMIVKHTTSTFTTSSFKASKCNEKDNWPSLKTTQNFPSTSATFKQNATFADKLKGTAGTQIHPFLDWRDQRTSASNCSMKAAIKNIPKNDIKSSTEPKSDDAKDIKVEDPDKEGDWTLVRKKKREKSEVVASIPDQNIGQQEETTVNDEAKKLKDQERKEKKKARAKEKKKHLREEKLLAEKLAPKGQKVTVITPQVMAKFLQTNSGRNSKPSQPVPAAAALRFDEELFPALGRPVRQKTIPPTSDSESEWETTEVEIVPEKMLQAPSSQSAQPTPVPVATKNVKRSDPVQWDLMSLINSQHKSKKSSGQHKIEPKRITRSKNTGVVANPLDRNAPVLMRGKIRNKKRKLSYIRKALLAAKAKKLETLAAQPSATETSGEPVVKEPPQPKLHSKKFREYCDQMLTDDIDILARDMLFHLRHFQDRAFHKDPVKGRMRKRLIAGLREVTKQVERNRVKIIFLAPDIQRCQETGGLDEAVEHLLESARKVQLPIVYALSRRKLGYVLKKNVPVSCCGVLNYQGTEEIWNKLSELIFQAKDDYQQKTEQLGLKQAATVQTAEESKESNAEVQPRVESETDALLKIIKLSLKE